jgi:hypothetical protein
MQGVARARYSVCRTRTVSGVGGHVTQGRFRVGSKKAWWSFVIFRWCAGAFERKNNKNPKSGLIFPPMRTSV